MIGGREALRFYSTSGAASPVSLREAVLQGLARDKGLFMPERIPALDPDFLAQLHERTLPEIAFEVSRAFFGGSVPEETLRTITADAINFDAPLVQVCERCWALELFHGPTLAFKDFGARFMARLMTHLIAGSDRRLFVLVATSGDTGSAVAHGFLGAPGIDVILLYPSGKVSLVQEMQLTTMGQNITALEVAGTFDDCQRLVKTAFVDPDIQRALLLSSANSINIARLIPQSFYYFYAYAQLNRPADPVVFSVPSGNFGNLTAGLLAKRMGLPVARFVAATNSNDVVPQYLQHGKFTPRASLQTISNAMDVGDPSNFARMIDLYHGSLEAMRADITAASVSDPETKQAFQEVAERFGYVMDPHGAVGYLALRRYLAEMPEPQLGIFLETAHPAKFMDVVEEVLGRVIEMPERLRRFLDGAKQALPMSAEFPDFKSYLLSRA